MTKVFLVAAIQSRRARPCPGSTHVTLAVDLGTSRCACTPLMLDGGGPCIGIAARDFTFDEGSPRRSTRRVFRTAPGSSATHAQDRSWFFDQPAAIALHRPLATSRTNDLKHPVIDTALKSDALHSRIKATTQDNAMNHTVDYLPASRSVHGYPYYRDALAGYSLPAAFIDLEH